MTFPNFRHPRYPYPRRRNQLHRNNLYRQKRDHQQWQEYAKASIDRLHDDPSHVVELGTYQLDISPISNFHVTIRMKQPKIRNGRSLTYQRKFSFQLKPPHVMSDAVTYSKVSSDITSMIGQTTAFLLRAISFSKGSNQPSVHSQCASRKVIVFPLTSLAPINL